MFDPNSLKIDNKFNWFSELIEYLILNRYSVVPRGEFNNISYKSLSNAFWLLIFIFWLLFICVKVNSFVFIFICDPTCKSNLSVCDITFILIDTSPP